MNSSDPVPYFEIFEDSKLAEGGMEIIELQSRKILLVKQNEKISALDNTCPHLGGSLGKGTVKNNRVVCPLHHWTFDLNSGKCVSGVVDEKVGVYEVKVENGKILLKFR